MTGRHEALAQSKKGQFPLPFLQRAQPDLFQTGMTPEIRLLRLLFFPFCQRTVDEHNPRYDSEKAHFQTEKSIVNQHLNGVPADVKLALQVPDPPVVNGARRSNISISPSNDDI